MSVDVEKVESRGVSRQSAYIKMKYLLCECGKCFIEL